MYYNGAIALLKALYENHCDFTENSDCILQKCTGAYHDQKHEYPIIYGDFFFIEAIFKLMGKWFIYLVKIKKENKNEYDEKFKGSGNNRRQQSV